MRRGIILDAGTLLQSIELRHAAFLRRDIVRQTQLMHVTHVQDATLLPAIVFLSFVQRVMQAHTEALLACMTAGSPPQAYGHSCHDYPSHGCI